MAYTLKTQESNDSVEAFIESIEDTQKKEDSKVLLEIFTRLSWEPAKMWWANIIGFWNYHYIYASGNSWDWMRTGFSPRMTWISLYTMPGYEFWNMPELMSKLWKYKHWKSCLNIKKLSDIDLGVLEEIITLWLKDMAERYPE